jgi:hypothetical protein
MQQFFLAVVTAFTIACAAHVPPATDVVGFNAGSFQMMMVGDDGFLVRPRPTLRTLEFSEDWILTQRLVCGEIRGRVRALYTILDHSDGPPPRALIRMVPLDTAGKSPQERQPVLASSDSNGEFRITFGERTKVRLEILGVGSARGAIDLTDLAGGWLIDYAASANGFHDPSDGREFLAKRGSIWCAPPEPPAPDEEFYKLVGTLLRDSLPGPPSSDSLIYLGTPILFRNAGITRTALWDVPGSVCTTSARTRLYGSWVTRGFHVTARFEEVRDHPAWILSVSRACAYEDGDGPLRYVSHAARFLLEKNERIWRASRVQGERSPDAESATRKSLPVGTARGFAPAASRVL